MSVRHTMRKYFCIVLHPLWQGRIKAGAALMFLLFSQASLTAQGPEKLISLPSQKGSALFLRSYHPTAFWPLDLQFVTQSTRTDCSIASSVMVLNALAVRGPHDPALKPWRYFTQDNFFTPAIKKILPMQRVAKQGATLDEISHVLRTFPLTVSPFHADDKSLDQFRTLAASALAHPHGAVIVNYLRTALKQTGRGHMSPLAAYDKTSDRFLIMDVARFRYPPVWVKTPDLWRAMHTIDPQSHVYRGFIVISTVAKKTNG